MHKQSMIFLLREFKRTFEIRVIWCCNELDLGVAYTRLGRSLRPFAVLKAMSSILGN
jgi:hypothetical protein